MWQVLDRVIFSIWSVLSLFGLFLAPFALLCSPKYKT
ncbi:hypothetical protein F383_20226 [Gossypium arboreum]|uniref:Uncharacterized protein n=1 Tax=Gossypium arboreum TaxID=29729 RepID=A0A0B0NPC7_GOSAR|nr:hypothetical protein F383_20226 [Gossypium arboreum]